MEKMNFCTAESAGHNHGVHVHHEEKPNPCQDPLARYVLGNEMSRLNKNGNGHHENGGNEEAQNEPLASSPQQPEPGNGSAIVSVRNDILWFH